MENEFSYNRSENIYPPQQNRRARTLRSVRLLLLVLCGCYLLIGFLGFVYSIFMSGLGYGWPSFFLCPTVAVVVTVGLNAFLTSTIKNLETPFRNELNRRL